MCRELKMEVMILYEIRDRTLVSTEELYEKVDGMSWREIEVELLDDDGVELVSDRHDTMWRFNDVG